MRWYDMVDRKLVDDSVGLRCEDCQEEWYPTIFFEYQGVVPHGGMVSFYTDEAWDCPSCGNPGEQV